LSGCSYCPIAYAANNFSFAKGIVSKNVCIGVRP
jgi:hypothetical protein